MFELNKGALLAIFVHVRIPMMSHVQEFAENFIVPAQLLLAMLGMGATLTVNDLVEVLRERASVGVGLALQWVFVPALTLLTIQWFELSPGWAVGLLLIAVVPGGTASNLFTHVGNGNTALSVALTVVTTLASVVTVPLMLGLFARAYLPEEFVFPAARATTEIVVYLLLPLATGMWLLHRFPSRAGLLSRICIRTSMLMIGFLVFSSMGSGRIRVEAYGWGPPLKLVAFGTLLAVFTPILCRIARRYEDDATAISIEVCARNIGLALLLVRNFFPGKETQGQVLYSCLFYAGMSFFLTLPMVIRHRRQGRLSPFYRPLTRPS